MKRKGICRVQVSNDEIRPYQNDSPQNGGCEMAGGLVRMRDL